MSWVETINLRGRISEMDKLSSQVVEIVESVKLEEQNLDGIKVYRGLESSSDISVQLFHSDPNTRPKKSGIGLHLEAIFNQIGMTRHSIWLALFDNSR